MMAFLKEYNERTAAQSVGHPGADHHLGPPFSFVTKMPRPDLIAGAAGSKKQRYGWVETPPGRSVAPRSRK
jgi:hypothetical protein